MKRMLAISEMYNKLKGMFADKTSNSTQEFVGYVQAPLLSSLNGNSILDVKAIGPVAGTDLVSSKINAQEDGIYNAIVGANHITILMLFTSASTADYIIYSPQQVYKVLYGNTSTFSTMTFNDIISTASAISSASIAFFNTTDVNAKLGGTPVRAVENSTLHIKGTFTPTATIAAGTKLFSTGQTLSARMTHGSAINSGTAGAETFVGISIQTNGDVYCLGALTAGITYNIAVTATL
jgi:hypothetical protein